MAGSNENRAGGSSTGRSCSRAEMILLQSGLLCSARRQRRVLSCFFFSVPPGPVLDELRKVFINVVKAVVVYNVSYYYSVQWAR